VIWICEHEKVTKWEGDIITYKDHLKAKVMKASNKNAKKNGLDKNTRGAW
jgi:ATP-binding cassette subfamily F protein 2